MYRNNRYGITEIFKRRKGRVIETLKLSWDHESNINRREERAGILSYILDEKDTHIAFNLHQAKLMREWLDDYIKDLESRGVKEIVHFLTKERL
jgi:DNA-binding transcriptional regulator GbsR (MarR family)